MGMKALARKIGITACSVAAVAAMVGSISGTIAWFQYSTRVTAAYTGTTAHSTENLQISLDGADWKNDLSMADVEAAILAQGRADTKLSPVTTGEYAKGDEIGDLYRNPIYQYQDYKTWGKATALQDYITFPIYLRTLDVNGKANATYLDKNVYLTDLQILEKTVAGKKDISDALRVHFSSPSQNWLVSKYGNDVKVHGKLDLNGDGAIDLTEGYEFTANRKQIDYGMGAIKGNIADAAARPVAPADGDTYFQEDIGQYIRYDLANTTWIVDYHPVAESYAADDAAVLADDSDPYAIAGNALGATTKAVDALAMLPSKDEVWKVNSETKNYKFSGTAWVLTEEANTKAVDFYSDLLVPADDEVVLALDKEMPYKFNAASGLWAPDATESGAALPGTFPAIDDTYHLVGPDKNVKWNGKAWVDGGDGSDGDVADEAALPATPAADWTFYKTGDKMYKWSGDGATFIAFTNNDFLFRVDVTIYLEGWQRFANKGEVANLEDHYLDAGDIYTVTADTKNYKWNGTAWVETADPATKGSVATYADLRKPTDSFKKTSDGKIYVYNGTAWVESDGDALWDAASYVGAAFNIGIRFSADAHTAH